MAPQEQELRPKTPFPDLVPFDMIPLNWSKRIMRPLRMLCSLFVVLSAISLSGESKNLTDYPLRIHIFSRSETTFYHNRSLDESRGEGLANLFENSEPRGLDFSFDCSQKVKPSFGFETYPAKWKKPNEELVVLFPVFGKPNAYYTCNLKIRMKDSAYFVHNGRMESEPIAQFKAWMVKHDYDPEHGKDMPTKLEPQPVPSAAPQH
jgi:hypothetical protein